MPTGYTAAIKDGISFEQFALSCARAFGACITMRDEPSDAPIPDEFQPSTWNAERLAKSLAELDAVESMTDADCLAAAESEYAAAMARHEERMRENESLDLAYRSMLSDVLSWSPPSPDHEGLKAFMIEQIEESIKFDCGYSPEAPRRLTGPQWRSAAISRLGRDISYHSKADAEEVERTAGRNRWVRQLRESLGAVVAK